MQKNKSSRNNGSKFTNVDSKRSSITSDFMFSNKKDMAFDYDYDNKIKHQRSMLSIQRLAAPPLIDQKRINDAL